MRLAVIVSTYNSPDALKKVLDGLLEQTRLPDEVLVADDGSDEKTAQLINCYKRLRFDALRIKHIWHEDKGFRASEIRNRAILQATSDYLILLDGDCIPNRHFVRDHLALAQKGCFFQGKRVIVGRKVSLHFTHKYVNSFRVLIKYLFTGAISNGHHIFRLPFGPFFYSVKLSGIRACNMGVFKSDFYAVNGFNQAFCGWGKEDSELVVRLYKYGLKRKEHPFRAICYHLWHEMCGRESILKNERLLNQAKQSQGFYCATGMIQKADR